MQRKDYKHTDRRADRQTSRQANPGGAGRFFDFFMLVFIETPKHILTPELRGMGQLLASVSPVS